MVWAIADLVISQPRNSIIDGRQDGLEEGELRVQPEEEQHDEEQDRPQCWNRKSGKGLRICHKGQALKRF